MIFGFRDELTTNNYNTVKLDTQKRYGNVVTRLVFNVMRSLEPSWQSPIKYPPLGDAQIKALKTLRATLNGDDLGTIDKAFHVACYTLFAHERHQYPAIHTEETFYSPVMLFLVLYSLRADGSFRIASQITGICAALEYSIRATMLVKIQAISNEKKISVFE